MDYSQVVCLISVLVSLGSIKAIPAAQTCYTGSLANSSPGLIKNYN